MTKNKLSLFTDNYYGMLLVIIFTMSILFYIASKTAISFLIYSEVWIVHSITVGIALLTHFVTSKGLKTKDDMHIFSMAGMGIRFLLSLLFIFIAVIVIQSQLVSFVVDFFILYLVYTSFEIYFILRNLRPDSKMKAQDSE